MDRDAITRYVKGFVKSPEQLNEIKRKGYVEIDFDEPTEIDISDNVTEPVQAKIDVMKEEISKLANENIEVNLVGFDSQRRKLNTLGADSSKDIGKLIKVRGLINATGKIKPMFQEATFKCRKCNSIISTIQEDPFKLIPPTQCEEELSHKHKCGSFKFDIDYLASKYMPSQKLSLQELPEDVSGQVPNIMDLIILKKSLLNRARCGDYVYIIGIFKVRANMQSQTSRITEPYIEVNNIIIKRKEAEASELSNADMEAIKTLGARKDVYQLLIDNIAPHLATLENEKEAMLLAMVGGNKKEYEDITLRDSIHILLVGDPSVGKSQLLMAVSNLAPLGFFTSGKTVSSAGLTAAVIKDGDDYLVSAGVVVLADKGIACIDEIDKMKPDDREAMHTAMEQQIVPVDKANIHTTLFSRTTIIAAANPILGRYDEYKSIADNIKNLPPTLLSRFDLIFIIIDTANKDKDELIVKNVLGEDTASRMIDRNLFKNYIIYAKSFNPEMTPEAKKVITDFYLESRKRRTKEDPVQIAVRQLQSLIRLAEAHARILLKNKIEPDDAKAAVRLLSESLKQTTRFQTAQGNVNLINNPVTTKQGKEELVLNILEKEGELVEEEWRTTSNLRGIQDADFYGIIQHLANNGKVMKRYSSPPTWRFVTR